MGTCQKRKKIRLQKGSGQKLRLTTITIRWIDGIFVPSCTLVNRCAPFFFTVCLMSLCVLCF